MDRNAVDSLSFIFASLRDSRIPLLYTVRENKELRIYTPTYFATADKLIFEDWTPSTERRDENNQNSRATETKRYFGNNESPKYFSINVYISFVFPVSHNIYTSIVYTFARRERNGSYKFLL